MTHSDPAQNGKHLHPWLIGVVIVLCSLLIAVLMLEGAWVVPESDFEYTQAQLLDETLRVAHDELIMLIISLIVVIMIAANFTLLLRIPHRFLLMSSFMLVVLSATCTVVEGLILPETLNYLEHLSFMFASILFAAWCWCVFASKKQGGQA